jgi:uncharacterized protein (DUF2267 family)
LAVDYKDFVGIVAGAIGGDTRTAERAVRATLQTLGERIGADESRRLVSELSPEFGPWLHTAGGPGRSTPRSSCAASPDASGPTP